jgi:hypothetical protein
MSEPRDYRTKARARRRASENLRCLKPLLHNARNAAKPRHHVFAGPAPSPWPKAEINARPRTIAARARWRTPRT